MRSVQTQQRFPLSTVKPLEKLIPYRQQCLAQTRQALSGRVVRRERSPLGGARMEPFGSVEGLEYVRCPETGSLFLAQLPAWEEWAKLLETVSRYRQSPETFHSHLSQSRAENVYFPRLEWAQEALRLQGMASAVLLDVASLPTTFGAFLKKNGTFSDVIPVEEMRLAHLRGAAPDWKKRRAQAALLSASLDRVDDPPALLEGVRAGLENGGLLFITSLVASGFDLSVLGLRNLYLYPPDRANCFTLRGLVLLLEQSGFELIEVSTPGVLDVEIVASHLRQDPTIPVTGFERALIAADSETRSAFQAFLQEKRFSSFARLIARKKG